MRDAVMKSLFDLAKSDSDVMLLTGDLGYGVFEEFEKLFPKQYLNVGVAEQNMMGVATGLAMEGKKIYTYSIGNFPTLRCLEQIRNDACYHELNINIIASGGGFSYGGLGMSHHATEDLSIMRALPGVTVVAPCTAWEAGEATKALLNEPGVGYLRIDKSKAKDLALGDDFKLGKARILRKGKDISIIVTGGIADDVMDAATLLSKSGIECEVIAMHTIKPIDREAIQEACNKTGRLLIVEENTLLGGFGSAIAEVCMDEGLNTKKFHRIGMDDKYSAVVGSQKHLRDFYDMGTDAIINTVKSLI